MTARLPRSVQKGTPPPAETGRLKTGAEFAAQMCNYFVLLGPGEQKKGGVGTGTQHNNESDSPNEREPCEWAIDRILRHQGSHSELGC